MTCVETARIVVIMLGTFVLVALFGTYAIRLVSLLEKKVKNAINEKHCKANFRNIIEDDKRKREQKDYGKKRRRIREDNNHSANSKNSFSSYDQCIGHSQLVWN